MEGIEDKIGNILNNPQMMQQIMAMAQSLGQSQDPPKQEPVQEQPQLPDINPAALQQIHNGVNELFRRDLKFYDAFFAREKKQVATNVATTANNAYIQASGDKNGTASYGMVATQLTTWYLQQTHQEENEESKFDPTDKDYISGIIGDKND
jgi:hypothetical protein